MLSFRTGQPYNRYLALSTTESDDNHNTSNQQTHKTTTAEQDLASWTCHLSITSLLLLALSVGFYFFLNTATSYEKKEENLSDQWDDTCFANITKSINSFCPSIFYVHDCNDILNDDDDSSDFLTSCFKMCEKFCTDTDMSVNMAPLGMLILMLGFGLTGYCVYGSYKMYRAFDELKDNRLEESRTVMLFEGPSYDGSGDMQPMEVSTGPQNIF
ncbi:MAG: hypothetical protein ACE365_04805 [Gammaproteobacteria bacterium]